MRNRESFNSLDDFIKNEIKNIDMKKIVKDYAEKLEENMNEIFYYEDSRQDNYYLNINLPKIENQYENYTELFWLKQLPFNINLTLCTKANQKESHVLNTYLEYVDAKKMTMAAKPQDSSAIYVNFDEQKIKFICMLGEHFIDTKCKVINNYNTLTFDSSDKIFETKEKFYRMEKDGVVINFLKNEKKNNEYKIISVEFGIKIRPEKKQSLKTPINILTELPNNEIGMQKLIELKAVEFLFTYLDDPAAPSKEVKAALWILAKIATKEIYGGILQEKYHIIKHISDFNTKCEDYAMKGTICYVMCYIAQNKNLRPYIEESYDFFFNTDICFPKNMKELYMNSKTTYENRQLKEDGEKINKYVVLNDKSNDIFQNVTSLINTISYKQSYEKLNEMLKTDSKAFNDPNLLVKIYAVLNRYKCREPLRRFIMLLFETAIGSPDIVDAAMKKIESIGKHLFESREE